LPAAGLGARPPSIHSSTADEGGFNEPSPEIKAKLKPVYDFDEDNVPVPPLPAVPAPEVEGPKLTYVDLLEHRVPADGNESVSQYDEADAYRQQSSHFISKTNEKIVYAVIKNDPPTKEFPLEKEDILDIDSEEPGSQNNGEVCEKGYHSPQSILDPTRTTLDDEVFSKKLPPEPPLDIPERDFDDEDSFLNKKIPPPVPELASPLDLQDVQFADESDNEEEKPVNGKASDLSDSLVDPMTNEEAERLLSSR
jgi:neurabin